MTAPCFSHIAIDEAPGEVRAALFDTEGRAWRLFQQRWDGDGAPAHLGDVCRARLRARAETQGGAFLELDSGASVFARLGRDDGFTEGCELTVRIVSEAHGDKLARVEVTDATPGRPDRFAAWRNDIADSDQLPVQTDRDSVAEAFDMASAPMVTLSRGGRLHIGRTRALTAFDVDTAGRIGKGSAGARALAINREAVVEMVRQAGLRDIGGLLVLDCVAPLNRQAGETLQDSARDLFAKLGRPDARVLRPSPLGLMEVSIAWRRCPLDERLDRDPGETRLLALLRDTRREAEANPARLFEMHLSAPSLAAYQARRSQVDGLLLSRFGGRVNVIESASGQDEVCPR